MGLYLNILIIYTFWALFFDFGYKVTIFFLYLHTKSVLIKIKQQT